MRSVHERFHPKELQECNSVAFLVASVHTFCDVSCFGTMANAKYSPLSPTKSSTAETGGADPFATQAVTVSNRLKLAILCAVTLQNASYALVWQYASRLA